MPPSMKQNELDGDTYATPVCSPSNDRTSPVLMETCSPKGCAAMAAVNCPSVSTKWTSIVHSKRHIWTPSSTLHHSFIF